MRRSPVGETPAQPEMALASATRTCDTAAMAVELTIEALGALGDGLAMHEGKRLFAPFALPGELVRAEIEGDRARVLEVVAPSPDREPPKCPHYGACGGCSLQHMGGTAYLDFKRRLVADALASRGIDVEVEPTLATPPRSRRRAVLAAGWKNGKLVVGFHGRRSHTLVPISDCAVLTPGLMAMIPKLERIARIAAPKKDALQITLTDTLTGVDVALSSAKRDLSGDDRLRLTEDALAIGAARLTVNGEMAVERAAPAIRAGEALLTPPPGGFLQASVVAEAAMVEHVLAGVGDARRVVDLFSGSGTFTLPLASRATVHAVESEAQALQALEIAARRTQGLKPVTTETRDLFRRPLMVEEMNRFDAAVIDPPRAGAEAQAQQLAKSKVKRIAMVSCNASSFARDVRILLDGGYRLTRVTPIDQFLWSTHIEIAAHLSR